MHIKIILMMVAVVTVVSCMQYQSTQAQWEVEVIASELYSMVPANYLVADQQGNLYLTGRSDQTATSLVLEKYNPLGELQWVHHYVNPFGESGNDFGHSIAIDTIGNVYVAGYARGTTWNITEAILLKFDGNGSLLWEYRQAASVSSIDADAHRLQILDSGEIYFIVDAGNQVALILNADGKLQRSFEIHNRVVDETEFHESIIDNTGNIIVSNRFDGTPGPPYAETLVGQYIKKMDAVGNFVWEIFSQDVHHIETLTFDNAGNIIVVSIIYKSGRFIKRLEKINAVDGTILWSKDFPGVVNWSPSALVIDAQNNIYMDDINFNSLLVPAKFSPDGVIIWKGEPIFADPATAYVDLQLDSLGRLYLTRDSFGVGFIHMARTFVYNPEGAHLLTIDALDSMMGTTRIDQQDNFYRLTGPSPFSQSQGPFMLKQYKVVN